MPKWRLEQLVLSLLQSTAIGKQLGKQQTPRLANARVRENTAIFCISLSLSLSLDFFILDEWNFYAKRQK
jgi:GTP-sensing pleiotropic transcriptional regulator CodY